MAINLKALNCTEDMNIAGAAPIIDDQYERQLFLALPSKGGAASGIRVLSEFLKIFLCDYCFTLDFNFSPLLNSASFSSPFPRSRRVGE